MGRKSIFVYVVIIVASSLMPVYAQHRGLVDSLIVVLQDKSPDKRIDTFLNIALENLDTDDALALQLARQAENAALCYGDSALIVMCWRIRGQILWKMERAGEAIELFELALPVAVRQGFDRDRMIILVSYGIALTFRSQYDVALQCYFRAQDLAIMRNDSRYSEMVLHNIGLLYYKLKDYRKAIFYWKDASQYTESSKVSDIRAVNISLAYANLGEFQKAKEYLEEATRLCGEGCNDSDMIQITYASGYIYYRLNDLQSAETEFLRSYEYSVGIGDVRMTLDNIYMLADLYKEREFIDQAFDYLNEAEKQIATGVPYNLEVIKIYSMLADLHLSQGEFENAALYQKKYIALKDSIYDETLTTSLMRVEAEYLEKRHRAEVAAQKEIISLKEKVINNQKILNVGIGMLAMLVLICSVFIYRNYLQKRSLSRLLDERVRERTAELDASYKQLISVLRERDILISRVTQDVIQAVSSIRGLCGTGKTDVKDPVSRSYFAKIDQVSEKLRGQLESEYLSNVQPNH